MRTHETIFVRVAHHDHANMHEHSNAFCSFVCCTTECTTHTMRRTISTDSLLIPTQHKTEITDTNALAVFVWARPECRQWANLRCYAIPIKVTCMFATEPCATHFAIVSIRHRSPNRPHSPSVYSGHAQRNTAARIRIVVWTVI